MRPLVIGNWKMHGSRQSVTALLTELKRGLSGEKGVEVVVCPPCVFLSLVGEQLADNSESKAIRLGAQNLSHFETGAHTGDIAGEMLKEFGCTYVIVGHSERRSDYDESNERVAQKYWRAIAAGLTPVLCVGETLQQREAGKTLEIVAAQLDIVLKDVKTNTLPDMVIAYEPVWAIGTGKTASAKQAQEVHQFIRQQLGDCAEKTRILYGGSVKPENAKELFEQADIDGGLIGSASLEAENFIRICKAARQ
jgi:triosephosphate isomerase